MIDIIHKSNDNNLILFIHGFMGHKGTWIDKKGNKPFIDQILSNNQVKDNFDIGIFKYHTELLSLFPKAKGIIGMLTGRKVATNLPIDEIGRLLESQLKYSYSQYNCIVLIGHSMGGLVAKRLILNNIKKDSNTRVKLYVSLATPHDGSVLATYGKNIIENFQVNDLAPLSKTITAMNDEWVQCKNLPRRLYAQGSYDNIVPKESSVSYDRDLQEIIYSDDDHFSIIKPTGKNVATDAIIKELSELATQQSVQSIKSDERFVDKGQYDEEVFVLKLLMADIHTTLMSGAKQAFFNAEFTIRKLVAQGVEVKELTPLYENLKQLYIIEFGEYITGTYKTSNELLNAIHKKILEKDKTYLHSLYQPLQGLQKFGMLQQLASIDNDIWWKEEHNVKSLSEFTEKLKAQTP